MNNEINQKIITKKQTNKGSVLVVTLMTLVILSCALTLAATATLAQGQAGGTNNTQPGQTGQTDNKPSFFTLQNPLKVNSVGQLVQALVEIFTYLVVLFGVLALVYVGFRFILARGNPEEMNRLKMWLMWIVIGLAVVIGARLIVSVVINTLGLSGVVDPGVIRSTDDVLQGR